jgi:hypothetical protein
MSARIHFISVIMLGAAICQVGCSQRSAEPSRLSIQHSAPSSLEEPRHLDLHQPNLSVVNAGSDRATSIEEPDQDLESQRFTLTSYQDPNIQPGGRFQRNDYLQDQERRSSIGLSSNQDEVNEGSLQVRLSTGRIIDGRLHLDNCTVLFIDDVKVPARESGQIIALNVKEGDAIQANQLLAQLDDSLFKIQEQRATISYENANDKATDMTTITAHQKEMELQGAKLRRATSLSQKGVMNTADYEIAQFEFELAVLKIKAAENARKTAEGEARMELAQIDEIKQRIARHKLFVDFDGYVIELLKQKQEWANAGDPVMRVARMDRLAVHALVSTGGVNPHQLRSGQNVLVTLQMAGGKTEQFQGKISNVSLVRETGSLIKIKAEVENRKIDGQSWVLQPLSVVEMVVDLN